MPSVEERSKTTDVLTEIRRLIVSNPLPVRQEINVSELAETLGSSATPIREALSCLVGEGFIEWVPQKGFYRTAVNIRSVRNNYGLLEAIMHSNIKNPSCVENPDQDGIKNWSTTSDEISRSDLIEQFYLSILAHSNSIESRILVTRLCLKTRFIRERILVDNKIWEKSFEFAKLTITALQNDRLNDAGKQFLRLVRLKRLRLDQAFSSWTIETLSVRPVSDRFHAAQ